MYVAYGYYTAAYMLRQTLPEAEFIQISRNIPRMNGDKGKPIIWCDVSCPAYSHCSTFISLGVSGITDALMPK